MEKVEFLNVYPDERLAAYLVVYYGKYAVLLEGTDSFGTDFRLYEAPDCSLPATFSDWSDMWSLSCQISEYDIHFMPDGKIFVE